MGRSSVTLSARGIARDTNDLHRLLVDSVTDYAIFALDPLGYIVSWNVGAERCKGYTADEAIGKHFSMFYPRYLVDEGFPDFGLRTAAKTGRFEDQGWRVRKDGSQFWANVTITALRDETGAHVGFAKVTRDLTERRKVDEALRVSEERFRLLVEGVKDYAIFMLDIAGRVATWNRGAERINGYRPEEIIGAHFSKLYPGADVAARKPERELEIASRDGQYEEEGWRVRSDGTLFWANVTITSLRNRVGELVGFAKLTRDLTERRAAHERALDDARRASAHETARLLSEERQAELRELADKLRCQAVELEARTREADEARGRADEANRVKSQFLAAMSHELRTPLNAIGGYADLLSMELSGPITGTQREQLARIKNSQQYLLGVINDILNFSRIEAGQLSYRFGAVPLRDVVDAVLQMVAPQAQVKKLRFESLRCRPDVVAWADQTKVEQILLNLVSNAVKFTPPGGMVTLSCERRDADRACLTVRDTGCGIAKDQQHTIFEPFVQVGRTLTNMREGTGLGLAISRDLARAMHGDISVESEVDVGSAFTLTLPLRTDQK
jgi:PAS domain S-box-containing protein